MSQVRFCPKCQNNFSNYFLDQDDQGKSILFYKCTSCLYSEGVPPNELKQHARLYTTSQLNRKPEKEIHADLADDLTLPRTSSLKCLNKDCPSHKTGEYELVFLEYNEEKRIAYICTTCRYYWKAS